MLWLDFIALHDIRYFMVTTEKNGLVYFSVSGQVIALWSTSVSDKGGVCQGLAFLGSVFFLFSFSVLWKYDRCWESGLQPYSMYMYM